VGIRDRLAGAQKGGPSHLVNERAVGDLVRTPNVVRPRRQPLDRDVLRLRVPNV
jgi:hypothetical protein